MLLFIFLSIRFTYGHLWDITITTNQPVHTSIKGACYLDFKTLIYDQQDAICYLTLNRPDRLNALSEDLMSEFRQAMAEIESNSDIRAVILTGAGRAFSAGFDIEKTTGDQDPQDMDPDQWRDRLKKHVEDFLLIWNLSKPVIAAVNGYALGGACEMVQLCDIKIASDRALFGEPEIRAGFGPPLLITPFSTNLAHAKELLLTGDIVDAEQAAKIGLVSRVVPHDQLMAECEKVARKIALLPRVGVKLNKMAVNRALEGYGFLTTIQQNIDLMTLFDISSAPEQLEFNAIREIEGLTAALKWRNAQFQSLERPHAG